MPYIQNAAKTMRNLKRGANGTAPYARFTTGLRLLEFFVVANDRSTPNSIDLKPGTTFYHDGDRALVTIEGGSGNTYLCDQTSLTDIPWQISHCDQAREAIAWSAE